MKTRLLLLTAMVICLGCKSGGDAPAQPGATEAPSAEVPAPTVQAEPEKKPFSWKNALRFVGFNQSTEDENMSAPQMVSKLSSFVSNVVAKSNDLNPNDPPEVTKKKAKGLLDSLRPWEKLRTAGLSTGVLNENTAKQMDMWIEQLRIETTKLVKFTPQPETIAGVKHLSGMLENTVGHITQLAGRGSSMLQAWRSSPAR